MRTKILLSVLGLTTATLCAQTTGRPAEHVQPGIDAIAVHKLSSVLYQAVAPSLLGIPEIIGSTPADLGPLSAEATLAISDENATSTTQHEVEPSVLAISKAGLTHTVATYFRYVGSPLIPNLFSSQKPRAGTWSKTSFPQNSAYAWYGDPSMDGNFSTTGVAPGRIYTAGLMLNSGGSPATAIGVWRSDDAGVTWSGPIVVQPTSSGNFLVDKPSLAVAPGTGTQHGFVYVSWVLDDKTMSTNSKIYCAGSVDGAVTFGAPVLVTTGDIEDPQVMVEPTVNAVYIAYPNYTDSSIRMKRSTSAGVAWDPETVGITGRPFVLPSHEFIGSGAGTVRAATLPTARYNAYASRVSIVWHELESATSTFTDVWYISKTGTGWTTPIKINDGVGGRDRFQPALDYDESGNMFVGFYDRRDDPSNIVYKEYVANIRPDGTPLGPNFATSTFSTNPSTSVVPSFIGDYQTTFYSNYSDLQQWISAFSGIGVGGTNNDIWLAHLN